MKCFSLIFTVLIGITLFSACSKKDNPCDSVACQNTGSCENGGCTCPQYVSGDKCEIQQRTNYYGTYDGILIGQGSSDSLVVIFSEYPGDYSKIRWDSYRYVQLSVSSQLKIPEQAIGAGETIAGTCAYFQGQLTMYWEVTTPTGVEIYSYTGVKRS